MGHPKRKSKAFHFESSETQFESNQIGSDSILFRVMILILIPVLAQFDFELTQFGVESTPLHFQENQNDFGQNQNDATQTNLSLPRGKDGNDTQTYDVVKTCKYQTDRKDRQKHTDTKTYQ